MAIDLDKIIEGVEKVRASEIADNNEIMENHLNHSVVVMGHAELVREGRREDAELAAALKASMDPTS